MNTANKKVSNRDTHAKEMSMIEFVIGFFIYLYRRAIKPL